MAGMLGLGTAYAQSTNAGDIRGIVTDPSGALIPGATVNVLNLDTGVAKDYPTNNDGLYDTDSIIAGSYKLTFTKAGFETFVRGPITVLVGYTTVNAELKVGASSIEVTVNTDVPLLNTESGDQTATLVSKDMQQMPNIGGSTGPDWQNFMILLPGAAGTYNSNGGNNSNAFNPGQEVATNGNLPFTNVLADGASTTLPSSQNANPAAFEDVSEVQVSLSSFSAQYGVGGLIMNQITKSGTDRFHGVLYEYFQNTAMNAANYGFGVVEKVPTLNYDNFGGTFSGPIPFLGLKKKAFFFFGYDQIHNNTVNSGFQTVPTAAIQNGDFSVNLTANPTNPYLIYDPTTQTIGTDAEGHPYPIRKSFLSEYGTNAIPSALIDTVSAAFQQYYPTPSNHIPYGQFIPSATPNSAGVTTNNFYSQYPAPLPWKRYFGRLDYNITKNNRLTLSDTQGNEIENANNAVTECPVGCQIGDVDNNNAQVTDVWNISPSTVNEARFGFTSQLNFFADAGTGLGYPAKIGWQFAKADVLPSVQFQRNYPYAWIQPATNAEYKEMVFDPSDVVTMIRGRHVLHFGGEFAFYRDDTTTWGNINAGTLQFDGVYTENWTLTGGVASPNSKSGEEYADFLLGYAQNWNASVSPEYGVRLKKPQMFVQDDWKIKPNLTINLGLRYEISHGFNEVKGNIATFDPTVTNPATNTLGAYWYGETKANGRTSLQANVFSTVMPRVGFSWLMHPDTTLRGGFGIYSYNWSTDNYGSGLGSSVSSSGSYNDQSNGIYPTTKFDGPGTLFPLGGGTPGPLPYTAASQDPTRFNGQTVSYNPYHTPIPKIYQWNFGMDWALNTNTVATMSYVGSHGLNLTFPTNINAVPLNQLSSSDTSGCGTGSTVNCAEPYPIYQQINGNLYQAISNYNALQVTITKRMQHGFSFSANYTWSHFLDDQDSSGWGTHAGPQKYQYASTLTANNASKNYGNSNFDVRNAFKGFVVYQLPFGKGQRYLNKNWFEDVTIGGWQVSGTFIASSGNPFQVFATDNTYQNAGVQYPSFSGLSTRPAHRSIAEWYNPAAFINPGNGNFGNAGRNPLTGPGFSTVNLSALKEFHLPWDRMAFSIRCDAQNAFNHPSFSPPQGQLAGDSGAGTEYTSTSNSSSVGQITGIQIGGRQLQLGARLSF
ncbi:MAG TPA: carboxypeptidase-like regulatory domain-containing protein [Acidobacteriaceae bacterium]|nr:carboxypeptidase-like regulatory domain-containing protein [Acidobacteriaceae bacterium]